MQTIEKFEFDELSRGLVWACDLANSSQYLNDNQSVDFLEDFLPRLYWTAIIAVGAAGGQFIKWTGDGFLAWFETERHRHLGQQAMGVFEIAQHLSFMINVTQLGLSPKKKFRIRHGVTYEPDALLIRATHPGGYQSLDLIGRAVVLACRLCGITASSPNIITQRDLVRESFSSSICEFKKITFSDEDIQKYFKGEKLGTSTLYVSYSKVLRLKTWESIGRLVKRTIAEVEAAGRDSEITGGCAQRFFSRMLAGPAWCRAVVEEYRRFIQEVLLGNIERADSILEGENQKISLQISRSQKLTRKIRRTS